MLQDVHSKKISAAVNAGVGTTVLVVGSSSYWIYVHELIGDLAAAGSIEILAGSRSLGKFNLDAGQGLTEQDEPGMDGVPRFECRPGEDFKVVVTGGAFTGSIDYSFRY